MAGLIVFNALIVVLGIGVASRIVPTQLVGYVLDNLHRSIGITTPPPDKLRMYALIWIASVVVSVDGMIFLFAVLTEGLN